MSEEQLWLSHDRCRAGHLRQLKVGGEILNLLRGRVEAEDHRREPLHVSICARPIATGQRVLVANPINCYLVNSQMLPQFNKDADGGLTLIIQNESAGKDKVANWLPASKRHFIAFMRLYWPREAALDGT